MSVKIAVGSDFGLALCTHLGLPVNKVNANVVLNTGSDEIMSASVEMYLDADDIIAIGEHMKDVQRLKHGSGVVVRKTCVYDSKGVNA